MTATCATSWYFCAYASPPDAPLITTARSVRRRSRDETPAQQQHDDGRTRTANRTDADGFAPSRSAEPSRHRSPQRRRRIHSADSSSTTSANAHGSCHRSRRSGGGVLRRGRLQPATPPAAASRGADVAAAGVARDAAEESFVQPRVGELAVGAADVHPAVGACRAASCRGARRRARDTGPARSGRERRGEPAADGVRVAQLDRRWSSPPGAVSVASTDASGTGAKAASRASTSIEIASPGSGASGTVIATGSGAGDVSHRAACRQKNS